MRKLYIVVLLAGIGLSCAAPPEDVVRIEEVGDNEYVVAEEYVDITMSAVPDVTNERENPPGSRRDYEYRLGAGDLISLSVWQDEEFSGEYKLGPDEFISIPLFGPVNLDGLTRDEARQALTQIIGSTYHAPRVSVIIQEYNNNNVFVLGEINMPGVFKLEGEPTLLKVLSMAGGPTAAADKSECTIIRGANCLFKIDLNDLLRLGNTALNIHLEPNDTIYLPDNSMKSVYVLGEVHNPSMVPVGHKMDLLRALTLAGSPTEDGVTSEVKLIRRDGERVRIITVDVARIYEEGLLAANLSLQPNDIIFVPEKGVAKFNYLLRQISPSFSTIFTINQLDDLMDND